MLQTCKDSCQMIFLAFDLAMHINKVSTNKWHKGIFNLARSKELVKNKSIKQVDRTCMCLYFCVISPFSTEQYFICISTLSSPPAAYTETMNAHVQND